MKKAISHAKRAAALGEVPVGAVVVMDGKIISSGYNRREKDRNSLKHAELIAINRACKKLGGWRLFQCELYVTMEPCPMCAGAIINSRIRSVYFGAYDKKSGCFGSVLNMNDLPFNHKPQIFGGIMQEECSAILTDFFKNIRYNKERTKKHE